MAIFYEKETGLIYNNNFPFLSTGTLVEISEKEYADIISSGKGVTFDEQKGGITSFDITIDQGLTEKYQSFFGIISNFIDNYPTSFGYGSIEEAISYYNSGITAWREEAIAFNTWRDNTLSLAYDNIYGFTANGITLPSLSGFTSQQGYFEVDIPTPSRPIIF